MTAHVCGQLKTTAQIPETSAAIRTAQREEVFATVKQPRDLNTRLRLRPRKGLIAQWCVQAGLPYRVPMDPGRPGHECTVWIRKSAETTVCVSSGASLENRGESRPANDQPMYSHARTSGLPWGSYARLVLAWLATEVGRTNSRDVELGHSVSEFFYKLGLVPTGGERGTITAVKDQLNRLMNATIKVQYRQDVAGSYCCLIALGRQRGAGSDAWWTSPANGQRSLWQPRIELSEDFFNLLRIRPVEIEFASLNALSRSPLAIDAYFWLCQQRCEKDRPFVTSWNQLFSQFGGQSARHKFVENFRRALRNVSSVDAGLRFEVNRNGISVGTQ